MLKKLILCLFAFALSNKNNAQGQFVNRNFLNSTGNPVINPILNVFGLQWSNSIITSSGDIITIGHTQVAGQGENVFLCKYTASGALVFQTSFNTSNANNDYGTNLCEAANGDILVCGTTDNSIVNDLDVIVVRFSSIGAVLYSTTKGGQAGKNDIASAIREDGNGNVIVAATTENTSYDYWVLQYDGSLNFTTSTNYDYVGLNDIVLGLEFSTSGDICLIGASNSSPTACDYAVATFDGATLNYISDTRNNIPGTSLDQATAFCKDINNNLYITGKAWNGSNFDFKTVKINANLTIAWTSTLNVQGFDDVPNTIALNAVTGEVIVGGLATKSNNKTEMLCVRLNAANGNVIKSYKQSSENNSGDAFIKKIAIKSNGDIYFVAGEKGLSGKKQSVVGKIKANGQQSWQKQINNLNCDILPSDIEVNTNHVYIISVKDSVTDTYQTSKFTELELDTAKQNYSQIKYKDGELIVRFKRSALNYNTVNNRENEFGNLSDYLTNSANTAVLSAFDTYNICSGNGCDVKAIKIFPGLKTSDSTQISRLGETIELPDFWTALLLKFPNNYGVTNVANVFNNHLQSVANYAEPNFLARLYSVPNDSLFSLQYSIKSNTVYPNSDVNVTEAWDVIHNGGRPFVHGGIFDTPIQWEHRDFNYDGLNSSSSKIIDGWNYTFNKKLKTLNDLGDWHSTCIAGVIGAQRNNISGVAGIAGGNDSTGSKGISLYNPAIFSPGGGPTLSPQFAPLTYIANALILSVQDPSKYPLLDAENAKRYKLHFQNHSWGLETPVIDPGFVNQSITLCKEALHEVNRANVTSIAARGNSFITPLVYPANADDDWVICVTGSGVNGQFSHNTAVVPGPVNCEMTSAWGGDIDISSPSSGSLVLTSYAIGGNPNLPNYQSFGGTSASAPHVSGAVGLMMSYLNDTTGSNNYKNMAPEDCEAILQMTATDTDSLNYDRLTGYGRLNIGKAMKKIQKPYHALLHFGTNNNSPYTVTKVTGGVTTTVTLNERFRLPGQQAFVTPSNYKVKPFRITSTVYHNIGSQDTIIASWPRPSSSVTWNLFSTSGGVNFITPREKTKIISVNQTSAVLEGFVYQVTDLANNPLGWWPVDTAYIQSLAGNWAEYSLLVRNYQGVVFTSNNKLEKEGSAIKVFPNPTTNGQTIEIFTQKVSDLTIEMYDIMGRKIKTVYSGNSNDGQTIINNDVSKLPNSLYIYVININGESTIKKIIKQ